MINLTFIVLLLIIFVIFYLPSIFNDANKLNIGWIKHNLWYYRVFVEYTISTLVLIFAAFILLSWNYKKIIFKKESINNFFKSNFFF